MQFFPRDPLSKQVGKRPHNHVIYDLLAVNRIILMAYKPFVWKTWKLQLLQVCQLCPLLIYSRTFLKCHILGFIMSTLIEGLLLQIVPKIQLVVTDSLFGYGKFSKRSLTYSLLSKNNTIYFTLQSRV